MIYFFCTSVDRSSISRIPNIIPCKFYNQIIIIITGIYDFNIFLLNINRLILVLDILLSKEVRVFASNLGLPQHFSLFFYYCKKKNYLNLIEKWKIEKQKA